MDQTFTLTYSQKLIRLAVFSFWRRTIGIGFPVAGAGLGAGLVISIVEGDHSWYVGMLGAVWFIGIIFSIALFWSHYSVSSQKLKQMNPQEALLQLAESDVSITSSLGCSKIPWSSITEVWEYQTFWLVFLSKAQFMTVPLATLTPEALEFFRQQVKAAGGKVA
jgi:hypothetical protein